MSCEEININLNYDKSIAGEFLRNKPRIWEALAEIEEIIKRISHEINTDNYHSPGHGILISKTACVSSAAAIEGPCIIDDNAEIRPGAYIRGKVIIGKNAVIGNSTEIKNSILFDGVQAPHYNYIGDSILGHKVHLGAGAVISNLRLDKNNITLDTVCGKIDTGMRKLGAIIGDGVEIGCNCVLNPGTTIESSAVIYPLSSVSHHQKIFC